LKACVIDAADLTQQRGLASAWTTLVSGFPAENVHVLPSIEHAVKKVQEIANADNARRVDVLVTGSLHLVGGVMDVAGLADVAFSTTSSEQTQVMEHQ
jgi:folylpolyglutamate synthase/dihydropteroate synthase